MSDIRNDLLSLYKAAGTPSTGALKEARAHGFALASPMTARWEVLQDFVDAYCRDLTPAGALVVAPDPSFAGATASGIPFTDAARARDVLNLACPDAPEDAASASFWDVVERMRHAMGAPPLEGFFAGVHFAHAVPYALFSDDGLVPAHAHLGALPALASESRRHLMRILRTTRPQVIACMGAGAFASVATLADNADALRQELEATGWAEFIAREHRPGFTAYPRADFSTFRARLVPLPDLTGPDAERARTTLGRLVADVWT